MTNQTVLVLDFGGQYKELIARRVRELGVLSAIMPGSTPTEKIRELAPIGIILTGGPNSVYDPASPRCRREVLELGIPVLGICYGHQLLCYLLGGEVASATVSEYGRRQLQLKPDTRLFKGLPESTEGLMSHTDSVVRAPEGMRVTASTADCAIAALEWPEKGLYSVQFHPEVQNTPRGRAILRNFLVGVCGARRDYNMGDYIEAETARIREKVGDKRALLALSGGVDSSVAAALLARALPGRVTAIFVDHGFMRKNEGDEIEAAFADYPLNFIRVNARERFMSALAGVSEPEHKRRIIGREFVAVFEEQAKLCGGAEFLAQGTIYPDVIESGADNTANIKSHHNVGGLPEEMGFIGIVEPLRTLFKDEVRELGRRLGLPERLVTRQPFPGPGLAIRVIGELTEEKLSILREADAIFREELERSSSRADQYFAVLTDLRSVGVMGDFRTYDYTVALRAVRTGDFMTCEYAHLPHALLERVSRRITGEVKGVNRVVYDITAKPPATIEWE